MGFEQMPQLPRAYPPRYFEKGHDGGNGLSSGEESEDSGDEKLFAKSGMERAASRTQEEEKNGVLPPPPPDLGLIAGKRTEPERGTGLQ